jgi:hypothetical protein
VPHLLPFDTLHKYDPSDDSIGVPVVLSHGGGSAKTLAKVDTGARYCVFQREHGEALGLEIERGIKVDLGTLKGSFVAYGHNVMLSALGYELDTIVYFTEDYNCPRNVLGRRGWIEQFRIGIVDYDGSLYVSRYDDP